MRVLFFSSIFPRPWDTTRGIFCFNACRAIAELGHDLRVVSPRSFLERTASSGILPGLSALRVSYPRFFYPPRVLQSRYDRFMEVSSKAALERATQELRPDSVLSYWAHPDGEVAARFARRRGVPSAVIVGGSDVLVLARHPGARRRSVIRALAANDAVITVGADLADAVCALGIPRGKVHVVYQGVDERIFSPGAPREARRRLGLPAGGDVLVSVGRLLPVKGIDILLDAMVTIQAARPGACLYLLGDGASRSALEAQATRLGLDGVVRFVGSVEQAALPDWYRAADLSVLASRSEGVPNVLRESLACGTPFVATKVGGVHEIAKGTANRLVPPENAAALARAVVASLEEPRGPLDRTGLLSWEESTAQILEVLRTARATER